MPIRFVLLVCAILVMADVFAQEKLARITYKGVTRLHEQVSLFDGQLTLHNIFKRQYEVIFENLDKPEPVIRKALIDQTYTPYAQFWAMYVGDSTTYVDDVMLPLVRDSLAMLEQKAAWFADLKIDAFFRKMSVRMEKESGFGAQGTWYIAFGHGVTDMGGFGQGRMVMDLTHAKVTPDYARLILPHEINHQFYDHTNREDTTARGLYRCVNEGFAVFVNQRLLGDRYALADYLQYAPAELQFCIDHADAIIAKLKPFLLTGDPDHATALADRGQRIFKNGGPGAIGYFVGYKIVTSYIERHGPDSWKDIYTMPVRDVYAGSAYGAE
jgi:hypothetical protein